MNVVVQAPLVGVQDSGVLNSGFGLLVKEILVSVGLKPDTVTVTVMAVMQEGDRDRLMATE